MGWAVAARRSLWQRGTERAALPRPQQQCTQRAGCAAHGRRALALPQLLNMNHNSVGDSGTAAMAAVGGARSELKEMLLDENGVGTAGRAAGRLAAAATSTWRWSVSEQRLGAGTHALAPLISCRMAMLARRGLVHRVRQRSRKRRSGTAKALLASSQLLISYVMSLNLTNKPCSSPRSCVPRRMYI